MDQKKKNISVRLSTSDIKRSKEIASRLGIKESELLRFGIKHMLMKLMPLGDTAMRGADLIPAWLECGGDLMNFFDIDSEKLDDIFNTDLAKDDYSHNRVDEADLDLMILSSFNKSYAVKKLSEFWGRPIDPVDVTQSLRTYLYEKYVLGKACHRQQKNNLSLKSNPEYASASGL